MYSVFIWCELWTSFFLCRNNQWPWPQHGRTVSMMIEWPQLTYKWTCWNEIRVQWNRSLLTHLHNKRCTDTGCPMSNTMNAIHAFLRTFAFFIGSLPLSSVEHFFFFVNIWHYIRKMYKNLFQCIQMSWYCDEGPLRFIFLNPLVVCLQFSTYHIQNCQSNKNQCFLIYQIHEKRVKSRRSILWMDFFLMLKTNITAATVIVWLSIVFMSMSSTVAGMNLQFNGNVITIHQFIAGCTSFGDLFQSFFDFILFFIDFIISIVLLIKCAFFFISKSVYSSNNNSIFR